MMRSENNNNETMLMELSIMATCQDKPSHFNTMKNSTRAMIQLMPKIIRNLVCDKGDEAI